MPKSVPEYGITPTTVPVLAPDMKRPQRAEHRMTVGELREILADQPADQWVVLYDPRLDRRLWLDHVDPSGHAELVGVLR